jgi:hypothetical protein
MTCHTHHRPARALALAAATLALAATPAPAMPVDPLGADHGAKQPTVRPIELPARTPRVQSTDSGLDWGSVALGGGGAVLIVLGALGALAVGGRRRLPSAP